MFRVPGFTSRVILGGGVRPTIKNNSSARVKALGNNFHPYRSRFQEFTTPCYHKSTPEQAAFTTPYYEEGTPEQAAAIAGSYYDDPMNVRYHKQVWGEGIHVGRYDLLKGMDTHLEGMDRIVRASALTRDVVIDKLFPEYLGPSDGLTVMDMGSGFGILARDVAQKKRCKVVCIEVTREFNAINATRSMKAGLTDNILIPGERSIFETGMPTASMDRLVSTDCFGHIDGNTDLVMEEAARVLKHGSLMVFTTLMKSSTADATALAKVNQGVRVTALGSPETFKEAGERYGMELVEFEDQTTNLIIHYLNLVDRIASVRGTLVDVDDSMLDARSTRCSLYADAGKRGCMIWGTSVFRKIMD